MSIINSSHEELRRFPCECGCGQAALSVCLPQVLARVPLRRAERNPRFELLSADVLARSHLRLVRGAVSLALRARQEIFIRILQER